jgi:hypothetical protein
MSFILCSQKACRLLGIYEHEGASKQKPPARLAGGFDYIF